MEQKHITDSEFDDFMANKLNKEERMIVLSHISSCTHCAAAFSARMEATLVPAPRDMKDKMLRMSQRPEVQISIKAKETSKGLQLFWYSLRVSGATLGALLLLFLTIKMTGTMEQMDNYSMYHNYNTKNTSIFDVIEEGVSDFNTGLETITDRVAEISKEITTQEDTKMK